MSRKSSNIVIRIIALVIVLALLGVGIGFIYRYTNGFNEEFKTFYLEFNGEKILQSSNEMNFVKGPDAKFGVKYTFDFGEEAREYNVKVLPNEEETFEYTVGARSLKWRAAAETADLSKAFGLKKDTSSFTLSFPSDMTIETVLRAMYPGQDVTVDAAALEGKPLYRLEVSSYNGEITYGIDFSVTDLSAELDGDHIVFGEGGALTKDEPAGGDKAPAVDERPVYGISVETQGSGSVSSIQYSVTGGAHAGDKMTFAVSLTDHALSIGNIMIMDPGSDDDGQSIGDGEGTFTFTMPPHDVCITVYLIR